MAARYFALFMGIAFTLAGIGGIALSADADVHGLVLPAGYGLLLRLFPVNPPQSPISRPTC